MPRFQVTTSIHFDNVVEVDAVDAMQACELAYQLIEEEIEQHVEQDAQRLPGDAA